MKETGATDPHQKSLTDENHVEMAEVEVFALLNASQGHQFDSRAELEAGMATVKRDPTSPSEALQNLTAAGIVELHGERVTLSKVASRTMRLRAMWCE